MANHYRSVLTSGGGVQPTGDAVAADVLTGKTFSNASAVGIAGAMPNNGAVSGQATPSQPYTIPAGYHNGSGVVTASSSNPILEANGTGALKTIQLTRNCTQLILSLAIYNGQGELQQNGVRLNPTSVISTVNFQQEGYGATCAIYEGTFAAGDSIAFGSSHEATTNSFGAILIIP